jgi:hypothetical protein
MREPTLDETTKERVVRYRVRAEQIRTTAEVIVDHDNRIALLRLAESYDRLVFRLEHDPPLRD